MKTDNRELPLDQFIELALYDKVEGYYMKKNPFGKEGDFITAPNITRVFSEIIAIWVVTFWKSLGSPKKFNLLELGAGNGEMIKVIIETLKNFPECFMNCNFQIHEKSDLLKEKQQLNLKSEKITWIEDIKKNNSHPTIFLANEFFDALPVKQYFKKEDGWIERFVNFKNKKKAEFKEHPTDIRKIEQNLNFNISNEQEIIEYSPGSFKYLEDICSLLKKNDGGILIIDYGYLDLKMHETLQAIKDHKYSNILENIGDSDITYNINFTIFKKFVAQFDQLNSLISNQKKFLTSMGIVQRAEIIGENIPFSEKSDLFYRIRRLIDEKQMGELFKVMLIKKKRNKFKTGFEID
ncbi:SAM-dependent methyltransferase [Candidatus Pelagibacter sp.]|nr:SAM-dependent methyltransferase [Candidatus Pelagibacter sp.]MDC0465300.1 SAM-dependent methyltransferase [Candidatus Pelagibacter sp.]MDC0862138.1 SAM-dependent methyltransferase [bacterium]MDC0862170.1 SAM-dependent methyltransferase [bacterium]